MGTTIVPMTGFILLADEDGDDDEGEDEEVNENEGSDIDEGLVEVEDVETSWIVVEVLVVFGIAP